MRIDDVVSNMWQAFIRGMVTRCTAIIPDLKMAYFKCLVCGEAPDLTFVDRGRVNEPPMRCLGCSNLGTMVRPCRYCLPRHRMPGFKTHRRHRMHRRHGMHRRHKRYRRHRRLQNAFDNVASMTCQALHGGADPQPVHLRQQAADQDAGDPRRHPRGRDPAHRVHVRLRLPRGRGQARQGGIPRTSTRPTLCSDEPSPRAV